MGYVEYSANNSGGGWWLTDDDWYALEKNGWKVAWASLEHLYDDKGNYVFDEDGTPKLVNIGEGNGFGSFNKKDADGKYRYMGALAKCAYKAGISLLEAGEEFDRVTSQCSTDAGCACCGQPHNFTEYDDNQKYVASGPTTSYEASW